MEEAIEILKKAANEGVKSIVATPHVLDGPSENYWRKVNDTFNCVKQTIIQEKIDIEIILGSELFISPDLPQKIKENKGLIINSGNGYVLLELPVYEIPLFTEQTIFELLLQGIVPIIAHPERYVEIQKDTNKLFDLVKKGVLTQLNSGSLMGRYGRKVQKTAKILLVHNLIHMIGSDVHSISNGFYSLSQGVNIASEIVGIERAKEMVTSIPEKVINGKKIDIPCPQQ
jgi:protein-tyrosine phosphatase